LVASPDTVDVSDGTNVEPDTVGDSVGDSEDAIVVPKTDVVDSFNPNDVVD